ncbi:DUF418 domain-containing protein [Lysinibacillus pakistanensis]|uniref:DUF418 domain-containing protein n=1 Tax=Lysinibacillus pakistanensis TaxID=759811 RepID=UPI003D286801
MNTTITQKERILSLDIIRGFALFGILFINVEYYRIISENGTWIFPDYSGGINGIIDTLIHIFIEKKFFSIFSFLFGVGFYIFTSRAESRGDKPRRRFVRRLLALLVIGIVHSFIFFGSILSIYAVIGLFLVPFYHAKVSTISKWLCGIVTAHIIALLLQVFVPNTGAVFFVIGNDAIAIFIMFLSGFLVAKAGWISHIGEYTKQIRWIQIGTIPFFIGFSIWIWFASQGDDQNIQLIMSLGLIPSTYFYLTSLFLILENKQIVKFLKPIACVGQMAFTNYVAQSFIGLAIISLMGLEFVSPKNIVIISILIFSIQIIFSVVWFKFFRMGPLEKVWRFMTYGKRTA